MTENNDESVGYRQPPKSRRFQKGSSGNPAGRPKGHTNEIPYDNVLGQMVTISENGIERRVTAAQAFLRKLAQDGLKGDARATKLSLHAIDQGNSSRQHHANPIQFCVVSVRPGNPNFVMIPLRMVRKLDAFRPTARVVIESWLVQAAVDRLGEKRLSPEDQAKVVKATRTPRKVRWPAGWMPIE